MKNLRTFLPMLLVFIMASDAQLLSDLTLGGLKATYALNESIEAIPTLTSIPGSTVVIPLIITCNIGGRNTQQITIDPANQRQQVTLNIDTSVAKTCGIIADTDEVINAFSQNIEVTEANIDTTPLRIQEGQFIQYTLTSELQTAVASKTFNVQTLPSNCLTMNIAGSDSGTPLEQLDFNTVPVDSTFEIHAKETGCEVSTEYALKIHEVPDQSIDLGAYTTLATVIIQPEPPLAAVINFVEIAVDGTVTAKLVLSRLFKSAEFSSLPQNFTINIADAADIATITPNQISIEAGTTEYEFQFQKPEPTLESTALTLSKSVEFSGLTLVQPELYTYPQAAPSPVIDSPVGIQITCVFETPLVAKRTFAVNCSYTETLADSETEKDLRVKVVLKQAGQLTTKLVWMAEHEDDRIYGLKFKNKTARFNLLGDLKGSYSVDFELDGADKASFVKPEVIDLVIGETLDFAFEIQNANRVPSEINYTGEKITLSLAPTSAITGENITMNIKLNSQTVDEVKFVSLSKSSLTFTTADTDAQSVDVLVSNDCAKNGECKEQNIAVIFQASTSTLNGRNVVVPNAYVFKLVGDKAGEGAKKEGKDSENGIIGILSKYKMMIIGVVAILLVLFFYFRHAGKMKNNKVDSINGTLKNNNVGQANYY